MLKLFRLEQQPLKMCVNVPASESREKSLFYFISQNLYLHAVHSLHISLRPPFPPLLLQPSLTQFFLSL